MLQRFSIYSGIQDRSVHTLARAFKVHCQHKAYSLEGKKPGESTQPTTTEGKSYHGEPEPHSPPRCKGGPHVTVCAPPAHIPLSRSLPRSSLRVAPAARLGSLSSMLQLSTILTPAPHTQIFCCKMLHGAVHQLSYKRISIK